uniref:Uncharacterized protein n=1 Tax=Acrobeloides nanus TaxID=290746 RepID=A0A914CDL5_9BILA
MSTCVTIEDDLYCALDVTVAIDFSAAMLNQTNIENLVNFVLYSFTNNLPFGRSLLKVALLSYGIHHKARMSQYFDTYKDFSNEILTQWNESKQDSNLTRG